MAIRSREEYRRQHLEMALIEERLQEVECAECETVAAGYLSFLQRDHAAAQPARSAQLRRYSLPSVRPRGLAGDRRPACAGDRMTMRQLPGERDDLTVNRGLSAPPRPCRRCGIRLAYRSGRSATAVIREAEQRKHACDAQMARVATADTEFQLKRAARSSARNRDSQSEVSLTESVRVVVL